MRRPAWFRALTAVWGLWFTTALIEPAGLFACAVHGSHSAAHATATPAPVPAEHAMHAAASHQAAAAQATHEQQPPTDHGVCTCLDHCCCVAPVAAPAPTVVLPVAATLDMPAATYSTAEFVVVHRAHELPFANGPPAAPTR